uniref:SGNH domain-containing protein n=1 Tax=Caenorhabditis tropicalis TaxID=1561998 RepID=A0A1I7V025_9PELO
MSRFLDTGNPFQNGVTRLEDDLIYRGMKTVIDIFVKSVKKKLFVFVQTPEILPSNIEKIVENVKNGNDLVEFDKSFVLLNHTMARMRYERLISECDKCESIIYDSLFWNTTTKTWRFYDEKNSGLSYVTTAKHLSFHGLELSNLQ